MRQSENALEHTKRQLKDYSKCHLGGKPFNNDVLRLLSACEQLLKTVGHGGRRTLFVLSKRELSVLMGVLSRRKAGAVPMLVFGLQPIETFHVGRMK